MEIKSLKKSRIYPFCGYFGYLRVFDPFGLMVKFEYDHLAYVVECQNGFM